MRDWSDRVKESLFGKEIILPPSPLPDLNPAAGAIARLAPLVRV